MPECVNCFNQYNETESSALSEKELYCSAACQDNDNKKLAAGNKVIDSALRENPNAFLKTGIFSGDNPLIPIRDTRDENSVDDILHKMGYDPKRD